MTVRRFELRNPRKMRRGVAVRNLAVAHMIGRVPPPECSHRTLRITPCDGDAASQPQTAREVRICCTECMQPLELRLTQSELQLLAKLAAPRRRSVT
jgi:hypothetical protein